MHVIDIGIPRGGPRKPDAGLIGGGVLRDLPRRGSDSTKFSSGNVFILGGSSGLTGAPSMSALAAMRAGAGYVTVGAPASLELSFTVRLLEAMMVGLPETEGALSLEAAGPALKAIGRADAVVLGPGLGKGDGARAFALEMFERIDVPLVIDADGLNALAGCFPEDLPQRRWPTVLTPHAGELGRLLDVDSKEVAPRAAGAREGGRRQGAGVRRAQGRRHAGRLARPARVAISRGRRPALATAGTGDVLSGVIGAMLAKGLAAGARRVRRASTRTCARARSRPRRTAPDGVIASDVIYAIPRRSAPERQHCLEVRDLRERHRARVLALAPPAGTSPRSRRPRARAASARSSRGARRPASGRAPTPGGLARPVADRRGLHRRGPRRARPRSARRASRPAAARSRAAARSSRPRAGSAEPASRCASSR